MSIETLLAHLDGEEPAHEEWFLPLAGREHVTYPSREAAAAAAVRICVTLGLPIVTPIRKKELV